MLDPHAPRVLLVEDDVKLAERVQEFLEGNGFRVSLEARGDRAVERIVAETPDAVVLDVMLPGQDGLSVCRAVRPRYQGAILMLTARGDEIDEVVGLEVGADDYMAKPVRPRALLARLNLLLRRASRVAAEASGAQAIPGGRRIELGSLVIDSGNRTASVKGRQVRLTDAEFDMLWLLGRHAGKVLTRDQIYEALRGIPYDGLDRAIDLRVARLRKKLGDDGKEPKKIKSVRGTGYLLVVDA